MAKYININGIDIEIIRKKIRNLHLHVRPDGSVYASVPMRASEKEVIVFLRANANWMEERKKTLSHQPDKAFYQQQKKQFDETLAQLIPKWEGITGLSCESWHSRYMTSRWGSCIPSKKRICLNLQLADKPQICLEYVILHELLHIRFPGHGEAFHQALSQYMPEWKRIRAQLK